jgi:hypothetical protein
MSKEFPTGADFDDPKKTQSAPGGGEDGSGTLVIEPTEEFSRTNMPLRKEIAHASALQSTSPFSKQSLRRQ